MEKDRETLRECRKGGGIVRNTCHKCFTEAIDLDASCSAAKNWQGIISVKAF